MNRALIVLMVFISTSTFAEHTGSGTTSRPVSDAALNASIQSAVSACSNVRGGDDGAIASALGQITGLLGGVNNGGAVNPGFDPSVGGVNLGPENFDTPTGTGEEPPSSGGDEAAADAAVVPPGDADTASNNTGDDVANSGDTNESGAAVASGLGKCVNCHTSGSGSKAMTFASASAVESASPSAATLNKMFSKPGANFTEDEKKALLAKFGG